MRVEDSGWIPLVLCSAFSDYTQIFRFFQFLSIIFEEIQPEIMNYFGNMHVLSLETFIVKTVYHRVW